MLGQFLPGGVVTFEVRWNVERVLDSHQVKHKMLLIKTAHQQVETVSTEAEKEHVDDRGVMKVNEEI